MLQHPRQSLIDEEVLGKPSTDLWVARRFLCVQDVDGSEATTLRLARSHYDYG